MTEKDEDILHMSDEARFFCDRTLLQEEPRREKAWESSGLRCLIRHMPWGYYCGYVEVPKTHPMFGKEYNKLPEEWHMAVNGGITFSEIVEGFDPFVDGRWLVGFDCAHLFNRMEGGAVSLPEVERQTEALAFLIAESANEE